VVFLDLVAELLICWLNFQLFGRVFSWRGILVTGLSSWNLTLMKFWILLLILNKMICILMQLCFLSLRSFYSLPWMVSFSRTLREENECAYWLAKFELSFNFIFIKKNIIHCKITLLNKVNFFSILFSATPIKALSSSKRY